MITTTAKGIFVWYELCTSDRTAALDFYSRILGWKSRDTSGLYGIYTIVHTPDGDVGGVMTLPPEATGVPPVWLAYIGVEDVDAVTKQVKAMGGSIHKPPMDIPDIGRFSVVADPQGAVFMLMTPFTKEAPKVVSRNTAGHVGWRELHARDGEAAWTFYSGLFGWTKVEAMDMGEQGVYQTFSTGAEPVGGMMTKMKETPVPFWMFYFNVEALDAAIERVRAAGGSTMFEPMAVPGELWIVGCVDPQGAVFSLVSPKR